MVKAIVVASTGLSSLGELQLYKVKENKIIITILNKHL